MMRTGFYDDQVGSPMAEERCRSFIKFLLERPEEEIIVVSHQGFLVNYLLDPFEIPKIDNASGVTVDVIWRKGSETPEVRLQSGEKKDKVRSMHSMLSRLSNIAKAFVKRNKKE